MNHLHLSQDLHVRVAVLTLSDTRTLEDDFSGQTIVAELKKFGHEVSFYEIHPDEPAIIIRKIQNWAREVDVILTNGGTGITRRDHTFEALLALIEKPMPGFGEIFRVLSFNQVGAAAMLSRASAGVYHNTLIFSMPGAKKAVELAMKELILPQLRHLVWELLR